MFPVGSRPQEFHPRADGEVMCIPLEVPFNSLSLLDITKWAGASPA